MIGKSERLEGGNGVSAANGITHSPLGEQEIERLALRGLLPHYISNCTLLEIELQGIKFTKINNVENRKS